MAAKNFTLAVVFLLGVVGSAFGQQTTDLGGLPGEGINNTYYDPPTDPYYVELPNPDNMTNFNSLLGQQLINQQVQQTLNLPDLFPADLPGAGGGWSGGVGYIGTSGYGGSFMREGSRSAVQASQWSGGGWTGGVGYVGSDLGMENTEAHRVIDPWTGIAMLAGTPKIGASSPWPQLSRITSGDKLRMLTNLFKQKLNQDWVPFTPGGTFPPTLETIAADFWANRLGKAKVDLGMSEAAEHAPRYTARFFNATKRADEAINFIIERLMDMPDYSPPPPQ
jgi:hypothetical protein